MTGLWKNGLLIKGCARLTVKYVTILVQFVDIGGKYNDKQKLFCKDIIEKRTSKRSLYGYIVAFDLISAFLKPLDSIV